MIHLSKKRYEHMAIGLFGLLALASFYICSRFTVDDAFITWRYGKNLVDSGIWGYNPTAFDLTQAYTNPLMAVLSIIPALLRIDIVLFFKLVALVSIILPYIIVRKWVADQRLFAILYLAFLALPATMIHAFSGLETFQFAVLLGILLIALVREDFWPANIAALLLLFTRPEAWLLIGLVPAYFFLLDFKTCNCRLRSPYPFKKTIRSFAMLGGAFAAYALFHHHHFGYVLPNTFYIKAGSVFHPGLVARLLLFLSPGLLFLLIRNKAVLLFTCLFFTPMMLSYASSDLQMDYMDRFTYHLFGPAYLLLAYLAATETRRFTIKSWHASGHYVIAATALIFLLFFAYGTSNPAGITGMANYYPRIVNAHAALGKEIAQISRQYHIKSFALSDAGAASYHAGIIAFDNNGLGSALVAHQGTTREVIEQYHPDLVVLRADDDGVVLSNEKKETLFQWAKAKNYAPICDVYLKPGYKLRIFSVRYIPELLPVCENSKKINGTDDAGYTYNNNQMPPWHFWQE